MGNSTTYLERECFLRLPVEKQMGRAINTPGIYSMDTTLTRSFVPMQHGRRVPPGITICFTAIHAAVMVTSCGQKVSFAHIFYSTFWDTNIKNA